MEFTADQYFAAAITVAYAAVIMFGGYIFGRKDGNKRAEIYYHAHSERLRNQLTGQQNIANSLRAEKDHLQRQAAELAERLEEQYRLPVITADQQEQISRAAYQLELAAQLMDAMHNDAAAKTQRLLASQLRDMADQHDITGAAA